MADTYIVTSSDLTSVANAIRTKTGDSAQLIFPAGFATAIGNIQKAPATYIEETYDDSDNLISAIVHGCTKIRQSLFFTATKLVSVTIPDNVTEIGSRVFYHCDSLPTVSLPETITSIAEIVKDPHKKA